MLLFTESCTPYHYLEIAFMSILPHVYPAQVDPSYVNPAQRRSDPKVDPAQIKNISVIRNSNKDIYKL